MNALVGRVAEIWARTEAVRGTQLIFCDLGVGRTAWGYSVYDEVIAKLVARGIPRGQVAAVGDADGDAKKQALFERVRQGTIRVLLGSTMKMGTGANVQRRLIALHHLDAPWKPAEVEQREGRILRQGNENAEVAIFRYVTEGSFDAYMWQALETKARFIGQVMTGENGVRKAEDIGGQELSYAEVKAIASGNPAVLTLAEADAELQRLSTLRRHHGDEQYLSPTRSAPTPWRMSGGRPPCSPWAPRLPPPAGCGSYPSSPTRSKRPGVPTCPHLRTFARRPITRRGAGHSIGCWTGKAVDVA